jgi:hypothetical protein
MPRTSRHHSCAGFPPHRAAPRPGGPTHLEAAVAVAATFVPRSQRADVHPDRRVDRPEHETRASSISHRRGSSRAEAPSACAACCAPLETDPVDHRAQPNPRNRGAPQRPATRERNTPVTFQPPRGRPLAAERRRAFNAKPRSAGSARPSWRTNSIRRRSLAAPLRVARADGCLGPSVTPCSRPRPPPRRSSATEVHRRATPCQAQSALPRTEPACR